VSNLTNLSHTQKQAFLDIVLALVYSAQQGEADLDRRAGL
jgi:hypothetical protein